MSVIEQSILNKNRKDKFLLVINLPDALKEINTAGQNTRSNGTLDLDKLQFSVYGAVVPPTTIPAVEVPFAGQSLNVTTGKKQNYSEITVNFTVDNGFNNWWVLWKWLNYINNAVYGYFDVEGISTQLPRTFVSTANLQPYQTKITVFGLDEYNVKKIQWTYGKAFITGLNGINYSYRDPEQIESSFTFSFSQLATELL
jgi:hypothetical protein